MLAYSRTLFVGIDTSLAARKSKSKSCRVVVVDGAAVDGAATTTLLEVAVDVTTLFCGET